MTQYTTPESGPAHQDLENDPDHIGDYPTRPEKGPVQIDDDGNDNTLKPPEQKFDTDSLKKAMEQEFGEEFELSEDDGSEPIHLVLDTELGDILENGAAKRQSIESSGDQDHLASHNEIVRGLIENRFFRKVSDSGEVHAGQKQATEDSKQKIQEQKKYVTLYYLEDDEVKILCFVSKSREPLKQIPTDNLSLDTENDNDNLSDEALTKLDDDDDESKVDTITDSQKERPQKTFSWIQKREAVTAQVQMQNEVRNVPVKNKISPIMGRMTYIQAPREAVQDILVSINSPVEKKYTPTPPLEKLVSAGRSTESKIVSSKAPEKTIARAITLSHNSKEKHREKLLKLPLEREEKTSIIKHRDSKKIPSDKITLPSKFSQIYHKKSEPQKPIRHRVEIPKQKEPIRLTQQITSEKPTETKQTAGTEAAREHDAPIQPVKNIYHRSSSLVTVSKGSIKTVVLPREKVIITEQLINNFELVERDTNTQSEPWNNKTSIAAKTINTINISPKPAINEVSGKIAVEDKAPLEIRYIPTVTVEVGTPPPVVTETLEEEQVRIDDLYQSTITAEISANTIRQEFSANTRGTRNTGDETAKQTHLAETFIPTETFNDSDIQNTHSRTESAIQQEKNAIQIFTPDISVPDKDQLYVTKETPIATTEVATHTQSEKSTSEEHYDTNTTNHKALRHNEPKTSVHQSEKTGALVRPRLDRVVNTPPYIRAISIRNTSETPLQKKQSETPEKTIALQMPQPERQTIHAIANYREYVPTHITQGPIEITAVQTIKNKAVTPELKTINIHEPKFIFPLKNQMPAIRIATVGRENVNLAKQYQMQSANKRKRHFQTTRLPLPTKYSGIRIKTIRPNHKTTIVTTILDEYIDEKKSQYVTAF